jgi:hypothetical protein
MTTRSLVDGTYVWEEPTFHTCTIARTHTLARHVTHTHIHDSNIQYQKNFKSKYEVVPVHILKAQREQRHSSNCS